MYWYICQYRCYENIHPTQKINALFHKWKKRFQISRETFSVSGIDVALNTSLLLTQQK